MGRVLILPAVWLPPRALEHLGTLVKEVTVDTPWGEVGPVALRRHPSGGEVYILPYSGHPTRLDPRGTVWAAKTLGVRRILTWERLVALDTDLQRGAVVVPDDYIDWTRRLPTTIFTEYGAGYIPQVPPFCPETHATTRALLAREGIPIHGGVYLGVDGPRRETPAEAAMYRRWGAAVMGMNVIPEVVLSKELELCYGVLGVVTELAADRPPVPPGGEVRETLRRILSALPALVAALAVEPTCTCHVTLARAKAQGVLPEDWRLWAGPRDTSKG